MLLAKVAIAVDRRVCSPTLQLSGAASVVCKEIVRAVHPDFTQRSRHAREGWQSKGPVHGFEIALRRRKRANEHGIERAAVERVTEHQPVGKRAEKCGDFTLYGVGTAFV